MSTPPVESVAVEGDLVQARQTEQNRLKVSEFLITANTNYRPATTAEAREAGDILKRAVGIMVEPHTIPDWMTDLYGRPWTKQYIKKVYNTYSAELGRHPKGTRIHAHIHMHIDHYTKLHVNIGRFKNLINHVLEGMPMSTKRVLQAHRVFVTGQGRGGGARYVAKQSVRFNPGVYSKGQG
jgi:hypothetical protein